MILNFCYFELFWFFLHVTCPFYQNSTHFLSFIFTLILSNAELLFFFLITRCHRINNEIENYFSRNEGLIEEVSFEMRVGQ